MPDLQTLARLAAVLKTPVPYFYCHDSELAEVIVKYSALSRTHKKKVLGFFGDL